MESPGTVAEGLLTLSQRLQNALEEDQLGLLATLLAERQRMLLTLGEAIQQGKTLPDELVDALKDSDASLGEAVSRAKEGIGRELANLQNQKISSYAFRAVGAGTFIDRAV